MESTQDNQGLGTGWIEFSERHARASSSDFARSVVQYFNSTLQAEARANISHKDLLKKFIDCFSDNFEYEYLRRSVQQGNSKVSLHSAHKSRQTQSDARQKKNRESHGRSGRRRWKNMGVVSKENAKHRFLSSTFGAVFSSRQQASSSNSLVYIAVPRLALRWFVMLWEQRW